MHALYVACLLGGAAATALFALLGAASGHGMHGAHSGGHAHGAAQHGAHAGAHGAAQHGAHASVHGAAQHGAGGHGAAHHGAHGHGATQHGASAHSVRLASSLGWLLGWLSPLPLAAAALWFGAAGLIAESAGLPVVLLVAVVAAVVGAALIRVTMTAFIRSSTAPLALGAEGAMGTVNAAIRPDAPGEVLYTLEGLHRSLPARSVDGIVLPRGTAVVIVRQEGGFAWVTPLDELERLEPEIPEKDRVL